MAPPTWKKLVDQLTAEGHGSPHVERLRERLALYSATPTSLELEIASEIAAALGRTEESLLVALVELEVAGRALDRATPSERAARVATFNEKRAAALKRRWHLQVHREAIGLRNNAMLATTYPIPDRRA